MLHGVDIIMERASDLYRQRIILESKIAVATDVLEHIEDPEWRNKKGGRATRLRLDINPDQDPQVMFERRNDRLGRLVNIIAPMRKSLKYKALPEFQHRLEEIGQEISQIPTETPYGFTFIKQDAVKVPDFSGIRTLPPVKEYLGGLSDKKRELVNGFLDTTKAKILMNKVTGFTSLDEDHNRKFSKSLAGEIFETIGYMAMRKKYEDPGVVVLSPEDVLILGTNIYENRVVRHNGLNANLDGQTLPDGMIIREVGDYLVVDAVIEYKNVKGFSDEYYGKAIKQLQNYTVGWISKDFQLEGSNGPDMASFLGNLINCLKPELSAKPLRVNPTMQVIYALPENADVTLPATVTRISIPITTQELGGLMRIFLEEVPRFAASSNTNPVVNAETPNTLEKRLLSDEESRVFSVIVRSLTTYTRLWWEELQAQLKDTSRIVEKDGKFMYRLYSPEELQSIFASAYLKLKKEAQSPVLQALWTGKDRDIWQKQVRLTEKLGQETPKVNGLVPRVSQKIKAAADDFYASNPKKTGEYLI